MAQLIELVARFQGLTNGSGQITINTLAYACTPLLDLINMLGAPESWVQEITAKVGTLENYASNGTTTLQELIDLDKKNNCVGQTNTGTRALVLLRRAIEGVKVLAEALLKRRNVTLKDAAKEAYDKVFKPHHDTETRKSAYQSFSSLPERGIVTLFQSADELDGLLQDYVSRSSNVINYIDAVFASNGLPTDG